MKVGPSIAGDLSAPGGFRSHIPMAGRAHTSSRPASSKANPNLTSSRKESARAEVSAHTTDCKADPPTAPRPTATNPEDVDAKNFLKDFSLEEDRPSECLRCRGRGYFAGPRICRDCDGTTYTYKDDGTRSRCTRCN